VHSRINITSYINDMRVFTFFPSRQMLPVGIQRTTLQFVTGVSVHTRHTRHSNEMRNVCVCVCVIHSYHTTQ